MGMLCACINTIKGQTLPLAPVSCTQLLAAVAARWHKVIYMTTWVITMNGHVQLVIIYMGSYCQGYEVATNGT